MPTAYDLRTRADVLVAVASDLDPEQFDTERVKHGLGELLAAREAVGEAPKIVAPWGSAWLQVNGQPSIDVTDEAAIPAAYKVQPPPPPPVLSRELVLAAWRDGTDVPGVVVTLGRHVRVK